MKENEIAVDVMVLQDGDNKGFFSYMPYEQAVEIQNCGGLENAECVNLRETPDRPIPDTLKDGTSTIVDILVRLEPNVEVSFN